MNIRCLCACAVIAFSTMNLRASSTATWEMNTYQDFIHGRFQGVSLNRDGTLMLAPKMESIFSSDQPVVWALAEAPDGSLLLPPGNTRPSLEKDGANIPPKTANDKVWRWSFETYLKNKALLVFKKTKTSPLPTLRRCWPTRATSSISRMASTPSSISRTPQCSTRTIRRSSASRRRSCGTP